MKGFKVWSNQEGESKTWNTRLMLGRLQLQLTLHRHRYPLGGLRVVIDPHIVIDVKE